MRGDTVRIPRDEASTRASRLQQDWKSNDRKSERNVAATGRTEAYESARDGEQLAFGGLRARNWEQDEGTFAWQICRTGQVRVAGIRVRATSGPVARTGFTFFSV